MTVTEPNAAEPAAPSSPAPAGEADADLARRLGVRLEPELLERALTHRSFAYEHGGLPHNERLEFLGDAVLGVVITDALFRGFPDLPEGKLAKLRASIVNMRSLADVARSIDGGGLGAHLRLGRGEETTGGRDKASILADTLEALLGAIYLEHGLPTAEQVIHRLFDPLMSAVADRGAALDWKTSLQELTASLGLGAPDYLITSDGPDHDKSFTASARVAGEVFGSGEGRSKKEAEQSAAQLAWTLLSERAANAQAVGEGAGADAGSPAEDVPALDADSSADSSADPSADPSARAVPPAGAELSA